MNEKMLYGEVFGAELKKDTKAMHKMPNSKVQHMSAPLICGDVDVQK